VDLAVFANVPESSLTCSAIEHWAQSERLLLSRSFAKGPIRTLPLSFNALLSDMPSRFRTSIRSTRRKLNAAYRIEFGLHDDPEAFDAALQALFQNHESRWRARNQSGVFVSESRRRFYTV